MRSITTIFLGAFLATAAAQQRMDGELTSSPGHGTASDRARVTGFRTLLAEIIVAKPLADFEADWGHGFVKADQFVTTIFMSEQGGS